MTCIHVIFARNRVKSRSPHTFASVQFKIQLKIKATPAFERGFHENFKNVRKSALALKLWELWVFEVGQNFHFFVEKFENFEKPAAANVLNGPVSKKVLFRKWVWGEKQLQKIGFEQIKFWSPLSLTRSLR